MIESQMIRMTNRKGTNVITIIPQQMITKRGITNKKAMLLVGGTNRTPVVPLSWRSARCARRKRCR